MFRKSLVSLTLTLFTAGLAQAQLGPPESPGPPDRRSDVEIFSEMYGTGASAPLARVVFTWEDDELCALLGTRRGPRQLNHGLFAITRQVIRDGKTDNERLKFDFPRKPEIDEDHLHVRHACVEASPAIGARSDEIHVAVRQPNRGAGNRGTRRFAVGFPPRGAQYGVDLRRLSNGNISYSEYIPPAGG